MNLVSPTRFELMKSPAHPAPTRRLSAFALALLTAGSVFAGEFNIIESGSEWYYLKSGTPASTWKRETFNPGSTWALGTAPFGYGDDIQYGNHPDFNKGTPGNRPIVHYFVKKFTIPEGVTYTSNDSQAQQDNRFKHIELRIVRDDAVAVYINGVEVFLGYDTVTGEFVRDNLPPTNLNNNTTALSPIEGTFEATPLVIVFDPQNPVLHPVTGNPVPSAEPIPIYTDKPNSIAVELRQASNKTSDARFDLELNLTGRRAEYGMARPGVPGHFDRQVPQGSTHTTHLRSAIGEPAGPFFDFREQDTELQWQITNPTASASWDAVVTEYVTGGNFPDGNRALGLNPLSATAAPTLVWKSEPIDLRNFKNVKVGAKVLGILKEPTNWASADKITFSLRYSGNGITYTTLPWITIGRSASNEKPTAYTDLVAEDALKKAITPTSASDPPASWKELSFDDSTWKTGTKGAGFENNPSDAVNFSTYIDPEFDFKSQMNGANRKYSLYIRSVFGPVQNLDTATALKLRMRYDDGFVAYINGQEVLRKNVSGTPAWNTKASATHDDAQAVLFEEFDISAHRNKLSATEPNVLAIHGFDANNSTDMLIWPVLQIGHPDSEAAAPTLDSITGRSANEPFKPVPEKAVPDEARVLEINYRAELKAGTAAAPATNKALYLDDVYVTGTPIEGDRFDTYMALKAPDAPEELRKADADLDGDSIANILEYAFQSDPTVASLTTPVPEGDEIVQKPILPEIYFENNRIFVKFRLPGAGIRGDAANGFEVLDLNVRPQISFGGLAEDQWMDGRNGVSPFERVGEIEENGDGSVTVTCRSIETYTPAQTKELFVRVRVGVRFPSYLNGREATPYIFN